MAKTLTLTIRVKVSGDGLDHSDVYTYTDSNAPNATTLQGVAGYQGAFPAAILVPPNSTSGIPAASGVSKTLKGVITDGGIPVDPAGVQVLPGFWALVLGSAENEYLIQL